jgi:sugar lactone lactonase YvrE
MLRLASTLAAVAIAAALALAGMSAAAQRPFPATIALPRGFQPEGIAIGRGATFYVGSIPTGAVYRGSLRTGRGAVLVEGSSGRAAIGVAVDNRNRLFVAGGPTGRAFVYSATTGAQLATFTLTSAPTFINDVVVTRTGAYFTDSQKAVLFRIPIGAGGRLGSSVQSIPLSGDFALRPGFNANGIDATPNGRTLVIVQSNTGRLFSVNPSNGLTREIALSGGETVPNGDGILLNGRALYVVQNQLNRVAVIAVAPNLASGRVVTRLTDSRLDVPTTIDDFGRRLYVVNARFGTPSPASADYSVAQLRKPSRR